MSAGLIAGAVLLAPGAPTEPTPNEPTLAGPTADRPDKALAVYRDLATLLDATNDPTGAADALRQAIELLTTRRKVLAASGLFTPTEVDVELADTHERLGKVLVKAARFDAAADAYATAHRLYADPKRANDPGSAARLDWNLAGLYAT